MEAARANEIWKRLMAGEPVDRMGLPFRDGRTDLRGLVVPDARVIDARSTGLAGIRELNVQEVRGAEWRSLDLSGVRLDAVRFRNCQLENCLFDGSRCRDWRLWGTSFDGCLFVKTDLRKSALGGLDGNRRNSFRKTSFERCDFRQTAYVSAEFEQCVFEHCKLDKVDFQGSTFVDCTFIGELSEVLFYRSAHNAEHLPANEMHDVDFSRARLRLVEFRGLDLKKVAWPQDAEHIITDDYAAVLECMIGVVEKRSDAAGRQLTALLKLRQKWAGSGQARSVFNRQDFEDLGGTSLLEAFETVLGMCQRGGGAAVHRTFPGHK